MLEADEKLVDRQLTGEVIGSFFTVYNALDYGFSENVYVSALVLEMRRRGLQVQRELPVKVYYERQPIAFYRMDVVVEGRLIVEVKSSAAIGEIERRQVLSYLRATTMDLVLLLHFGPKPRFHRFIWTRKNFGTSS
jgi:GxxExxY protein